MDNVVSINTLKNKLINIITHEYDLDNTERAKVKFGLEVITGSIFKLTVLLTTFYFLGIFYQSLFAMCSSGLFRLASGGYHCNTYSKCLMLSLFSFSMIGLICNTFVIANTYYYAIATIILIITIYKAPVDPFRRPIDSMRKYIMKTISSLILILLIALPIALDLNNDLKNAILLAICYQVFTITAYGYRLILLINQLSFRLKERR